MPFRSRIQEEIKLFCGFSGKLLAGIGTILICQRRNYAGFKRISWIFAGKWTVFFANRWGIRREMREYLGILDAGQWSLIAVEAVYKTFFS